MSLKLRQYLRKCSEVTHTTIDPYRKNAVRIHLVPPAKRSPGIPWVLILNGQDILPLNTSWAVLLREFIGTVNAHAGKVLDAPLLKGCIGETVRRMLEIFPRTDEKVIRADLAAIVRVITAVGAGNTPDADTGYMTLAEYAPYMRSPHRMDLMVSAMTKNGCWNCNQKCLHCYAAGQPMSEMQEMTTEQWKQAIDRLRREWVTQVTFTGGEPTLRSDLPELVAHASWFVTRLNTNGILLTPELCRRLMEASLDSVQVTLYACDADIHNRLVGASQFEKTVAGIRSAVEAGLNVSVNTPLCSLNTEYNRLLEFCRDLGVKYFSCSGLIPTGGAAQADSVATRLDASTLEGILRGAMAYCRKNELDLNFTSPGWLSDKVLRSMGLNPPACGACLSNMAVAPDGTVVPCQSWLNGTALGNILETPWEKIWNHPEAAAIRSRAVEPDKKCLLWTEGGGAR